MKSSKFLFSLLVIVTFLIGLLSKKILNTDELIYQSLSDLLTVEQLQTNLNFQKKWEWLSYMFIPLLLLIKLSIIASVLDIGVFFYNKKLKYKQIFKLVLKADFLFLIAIFVKIIWFYFIKHNFTLLDLQYFYPLSAINITGYQDLDPWFVYPFQVLNLFEVAYWFILAYFLGKELKISTEKSMNIVASSYGVGLVIWVVVVMFFTVNMS